MTAQSQEYRMEEMGGTLFLIHGVLVLAANVGEAGEIPDEIRNEFKQIVDTMNAASPENDDTAASPAKA